MIKIVYVTMNNVNVNALCKYNVDMIFCIWMPRINLWIIVSFHINILTLPDKYFMRYIVMNIWSITDSKCYVKDEFDHLKIKYY